MSFARPFFQYITTACSPTALYHNVESMLKSAYDFLSPKAKEPTATIADWPTERLAIELIRPASAQRSSRLVKNASTRSLPTGNTSNRSLGTNNSNRSISGAGISYTPPLTDRNSSRSLTPSPPQPLSADAKHIPMPIFEAGSDGFRENPRPSSNSPPETSANRSDRVLSIIENSPARPGPQTLPSYKYSHYFNSSVLGLYLLWPLVAGLLSSYSDQAKSKNALLGEMILGISVMINFALFLNIYETKIDLKFGGIRLHNPNDSIDTDIKKDLLHMLPKALIATLVTALIDTRRNLDAKAFITNTALSISLAITWQLARTYMHRPEKSLTSLSSWLAGCFIMVNAALSAYGTFLYLSPVISVGANPPIPNSMPRAFWIPAFSLAALAFINFTLQTHYNKQSKPITQWLTRLTLVNMNAKSLLGLLYLVPEIAFLGLQPNQDTLDATAHYIMPVAFILAIGASFFNGPAKNYLKAHQRYLRIIDPSLANVDPRPLSNAEEDLSTWTCIKQSAQFPIKLLIYIADVITASTQVQRLLSVPYSSATSPGSTVALAAVTSIFGLIGGLHATLETSANVKESKHKRRFQCGKLTDIGVTATVLTASAAYTLTFPYGILAIYYNQPLNQLIAAGTLPTSDFANGAILGAALAFAYFYTAVIKRRPIAEGMIQNSSLVRMDAVRARLFHAGSSNPITIATATTETDHPMATNPFQKRLAALPAGDTHLMTRRQAPQ